MTAQQYLEHCQKLKAEAEAAENHSLAAMYSRKIADLEALLVATATG